MFSHQPNSDNSTAHAFAMSNQMAMMSQVSGFPFTQSKTKDGSVAQLNQDSLLGMAASVFDLCNNNAQGFLRSPSDAQSLSTAAAATTTTTPEAITSQVLHELANDLFDDADDLFDSAELEPLPIDQSRMNVVSQIPLTAIHGATRYEQPHQPSHIDFVTDTLSQILSGEENAPFVGTPVPSFPSSMQRAQQPPKRERNPSPDQPAVIKRQKLEAPSAAATSASEETGRRFRPYQAEQWTEKFEELCQFRAERGHCCVPHTFKENPSLARWVKRQRYQYKLKQEGKQSTMTDERVVALEEVGFIWDSHGAAWEDRLNELREYKNANGHCNVPSNHPENPQLATWVKCQRRQYKLFYDGKQSNMTLQRISQLEMIGFEWELRSHKTKL